MRSLSPSREHLALSDVRKNRGNFQEERMNWDQIRGNWNQAKGELKKQWGKLTDDDFAKINGERDQLVGRIQERYGYAKEQAEREVENWERGSKA
jgi:uncharacterized protein YjbJ (UPF0337 family)